MSRRIKSRGDVGGSVVPGLADVPVRGFLDDGLLAEHDEAVHLGVGSHHVVDDLGDAEGLSGLHLVGVCDVVLVPLVQGVGLCLVGRLGVRLVNVPSAEPDLCSSTAKSVAHSTIFSVQSYTFLMKLPNVYRFFCLYSSSLLTR